MPSSPPRARTRSRCTRKATAWVWSDWYSAVPGLRELALLRLVATSSRARAASSSCARVISLPSTTATASAGTLVRSAAAGGDKRERGEDGERRGRSERFIETLLYDGYVRCSRAGVNARLRFVRNACATPGGCTRSGGQPSRNDSIGQLERPAEILGAAATSRLRGGVHGDVESVAERAQLARSEARAGRPWRGRRGRRGSPRRSARASASPPGSRTGSRPARGAARSDPRSPARSSRSSSSCSTSASRRWRSILSASDAM